MNRRKRRGVGLIILGVITILVACGGNQEKTGGADKLPSTGKGVHSAVVITDIGGVDDKSFNQSAWEGLQAWGKENELTEGAGGFAYIQSTDASEYTTNMDQAISSEFKTIFGVGYLLRDAVEIGADASKETNFCLIDGVIEDKDNVVSAIFQANESSYLAGVAAAHTTKTNYVGFIGGEEGPVIGLFEAGFAQGVMDTAKQLKKNIKVDIKYAASFGDPAKGKALAAAMYQGGSDIIFHASGGTGTGVFQEAKDLNEIGDRDKVWVIGVDRDQDEDGIYQTKDGKKDNFTLTSTLKSVGAVVQDIANRAQNETFPGGELLVYGLKDGGVDVTDGYLTEEAKVAVSEAREKIISKNIRVNETP